MVLKAVRRGAFFGALSDRLEENREYTRKTSDAMQEYLWTAGLNRRNEVKKSKTQLQEAYDYLTGNGLEEDRALALLDTDPKEMLSLYTVAQNYKLKSGRLTPNILNSAVTMAEGYESTGMTASELIKKAAPDFVEGAEIDPPAQERSFLGKLIGTPSMDEIRYDVYSSEIMGRKGSDIMASISEPTIRARDAAGGVDTDYTGLGAMSTTDILQVQRQIMLDYDAELERKKASLISAVDGATGDERTDLQNRRLELERISDIDDPKEQLRKMMQNPDLGFGIAQQYYRTTPQSFIDRPEFIDNDLLPFISGDNETTTEPTGDPTEDPEERTEDTTEERTEERTEDTTEFNVLDIEEGENPMTEARKFFKNNPPRQDFMADKIVGIKLSDGTTKFYRFVSKRSQGLGFPDKITVEEVLLSEITG